MNERQEVTMNFGGKPRFDIYTEMEWLDPFDTLAFLAGVTQKVHLGLSVLIVPYRHPFPPSSVRRPPLLPPFSSISAPPLRLKETLCITCAMGGKELSLVSLHTYQTFIDRLPEKKRRLSCGKEAGRRPQKP